MFVFLAYLCLHFTEQTQVHQSMLQIGLMVHANSLTLDTMIDTAEYIC